MKLERDSAAKALVRTSAIANVNYKLTQQASTDHQGLIIKLSNRKVAGSLIYGLQSTVHHNALLNYDEPRTRRGKMDTLRCESTKFSLQASFILPSRRPATPSYSFIAQTHFKQSSLTRLTQQHPPD